MYPPNQGGSQEPFSSAPQGAATGSAFGAVPVAPGSPQGSPFRTAPGMYEFSASENQIIASIATATKVNGVASLVSIGVTFVHTAALALRLSSLGSGATVSLGTPMLGAMVGVILQLVIARAMFQSSAAFQRVVDTQGNDIPNLVEALTHQRSFFKLMRALMILALVFGLLAVMAAMALGAMFAAAH